MNWSDRIYTQYSRGTHSVYSQDSDQKIAEISRIYSMSHQDKVAYLIHDFFDGGMPTFPTLDDAVNFVMNLKLKKHTTDWKQDGF